MNTSVAVMRTPPRFAEESDAPEAIEVPEAGPVPPAEG